MKPLFGCSSIDDYRIQEKLGEGTFGHVHRAIHKDTSQVVALKEIIINAKDDGMPITALREIRILKKLRHINVLEMLDVAVKRGSKSRKLRAVFYMVTPYMDHDLAGLLGNSKVQLRLGHIKCYMEQLLQGMCYLHDQHYMHRDIKAANILIDNLGIVKIADFGLARHYHEQVPTLQGAGPQGRKYTATVVTRWYRSPELLLGEQRYTTAIDMWGVGCVFGEIFKRKPIFQGKSDTDQVQTIFSIMGSPNEQSMPGLSALPGASLCPKEPLPPQVDTTFSNIPVLARALLRGLLDFDPLKRLSALGALDHEFFSSDPPAAKPNELPIYKSSHELDARKQAHLERQRAKREERSPVRRRKLAFKIPKRSCLSGLDLVPPYRRDEARVEVDLLDSVRANRERKPQSLNY